MKSNDIDFSALPQIDLLKLADGTIRQEYITDGMDQLCEGESYPHEPIVGYEMPAKLARKIGDPVYRDFERPRSKGKGRVVVYFTEDQIRGALGVSAYE